MFDYSTSHMIRAYLFSAVSSFCFIVNSHSQGTLNPGQHNVTPFGAFDGSNIDHVDLSNGALSMTIPLYTSVQKDGKAKFVYYLVVDGSMRYTATAQCASSGDRCSFNYAMGNEYPGARIVSDDEYVLRAESKNANVLSGSLGTVVGYEVLGQDNQVGTAGPYLTTNYRTAIHYVDDPIGGRHYLGYDASSDHTKLRAYDGSGYYESISDPNAYKGVALGTLYRPDGSHYVPDGTDSLGIGKLRLIDANGNTLKYQNESGDYIDSLGRKMAGWETASGTALASCPNLGLATQPVKSARYFSFPGPSDLGDGRIRVLVCFTAFQYRTNFLGQNGQQGQQQTVNPITVSGPREDIYTEASGSINTIQSVVLPDGTYWSFTFDAVDPNNPYSTAYGDLTSTHLPTGGVISYHLETEPTCVASTDSFYLDNGGGFPYHPFSRTVTDRNVSDGSTTSSWGYAYNLAQMTTDVIKPDNNQTRHTFQAMTVNGQNSCAAEEVLEKVYQGAIPNQYNPGGTLLKTTTKTYYTYENSQAPSLLPELNGASLVTDFLHTVTSNFLDGESTTVTYTYDSGFGNAQPLCITGSGGSPGNCWSDYSTSVIMGLPKGTATMGPDGKGGTLTQTRGTQYKWEEAAYHDSYLNANVLQVPSQETLAGAGGNSVTTTYGYDETGSPSGPIGNLTSVSKTGPQGGLQATQMIYNGFGQVTSATVGTYAITYHLDDSDSPFPTQIDLPQTSGVTHIQKLGWDPNTAQLLLKTDEGQVQTKFVYHGPLAQITSEINAYQTSIQSDVVYDYSNANQPVVKMDQVSVNDGLIVSKTVLDGLGRVISVHNPDGSVVDTAYDAVGNVYSVTNPYLPARPNSSDGITTFAYDALGRKLLQCQPDNGGLAGAPCTEGASFRKWIYDGNKVTYQDESGFSSIRTMDALGRVVSLQEIGSAAAPKSLSTFYTYDVQGNLLSVNQAGIIGETARNRSFGYDALSRLLTSTNPETGTVCYGLWNAGTCQSGYDANGNIHVKTNADGNVVTYGYDTLNRLVSRSFSGSPSSCYQYDTSLVAAPGANMIGRLAQEWTQMGDCPSAPPTTGALVLTRKSAIAYDALGRMLKSQQCVLTMCTANASFQVEQMFDLAGNQTFLKDPVKGVQFTSYYDGAGRLKSVLSNWNDSNHPPQLFEVQSYSPAGLEDWTLGTSLNLHKTYDSRSRPTSEIVTHP